MNRTVRSVVFMVVLCGLLSLETSQAAGPKKNFHKDPPDLTQGGKPDDSLDWRLGPIGANGWCFSRNTGNGASALARQILITRVDTNGPAAGKLQLDDVIVGIGGKKFASDARRVLADAINKAEEEASAGRLNLLVWRPVDQVQGGDGPSTELGAGPSTGLRAGPSTGLRAGKEQEITLTLPVMGSYSETAPYNCKKTDKIIDNACAYMKTREIKPGWLGFIDGLGMLATGREDLMPQIKALAHAAVVPGEVLSIEKHVGMKCWDWSYKTLFLCEYYLATKDEYVLPTITEYATKIAMGQSGAGTWGHTYAAIENSGHMHGYLGGYGAINQMGLTLMIVLPLAEKCGVKNKEVSDAIVRGDNFFSYFIDRGTIPYGDHGAANEWYDDNGKSGSAAIFFDLMGNRKGTQFFSEMILASAQGGREAGHTGCFWSHLWGGIGAARGGDLALQTYMNDMNWAFTLERQPDGHMVFQGNAGEAGDKGDAKTKWDCTGARLLQFCVPRGKLYITGKETPRDTHLTPARIAQIRAAGRLDVDKDAREKLELPHILALLKDPLPPTRSIGAQALAERKLNSVDQLIPMLESENRYARYGAAEALCNAGFGNKEAADKLISLMASDKDVTFKVYAIAALINRDKEKGLLAVAKPAIPVLLKMAVEHTPDDPRRVLQNEISRALFYKGNAQPRRGLLVEYGLEGVDRELLFPAMREILTNENGGARSQLSWVYEKLTDEELQKIWGDIYRATKDLAPSGIMFASGIRTAGLKAMADHRINEGLDLAAWYIKHQKGHGAPGRVPEALDSILKYGGHAKRVIPVLGEDALYWEAKRNPRQPIPPDDPANLIHEAIKKIEAMDTPVEELKSIAAYIKDKKEN